MTVRVRVIPCLDVANGRVVKGVNFVDLAEIVARAYDSATAGIVHREGKLLSAGARIDRHKH